MNIRLATKEDSHRLEELAVTVNGEEHRALAQSYINATFSDVFRSPTFIVADKEGELIGCAAFSQEIFTVGIWGISWVSVHPDHERQGIGQKLIEACFKAIEKRAGRRFKYLSRQDKII